MTKCRHRIVTGRPTPLDPEAFKVVAALDQAVRWPPRSPIGDAAGARFTGLGSVWEFARRVTRAGRTLVPGESQNRCDYRRRSAQEPVPPPTLPGIRAPPRFRAKSRRGVSGKKHGGSAIAGGCGE